MIDTPSVPIRILSRYDINSLITRHLNTPVATYSYDIVVSSFSLVASLLTTSSKLSTWFVLGRLVDQAHKPQNMNRTKLPRHDRLHVLYARS